MTTGSGGEQIRQISRVFIAGALARCCAAVIMFPVDSIKTRLQFQRESISSSVIRQYHNGFHAFREIIRSEGVLALYKGLPIRLLYITPAAAVSFSVYEEFKRQASKQEKFRGVTVTLLAGALARVLGTACRTPFDLLKQQLQVENQIHNLEKKGYVESFRVIRSAGWRGFFIGYKITLLRDLPFASLYFSTYELVKGYLERSPYIREWSGFPQHQYHQGVNYLVSGAFAGALATILTCHADVVKTRLQTQSRLMLQLQKQKEHIQTTNNIINGASDINLRKGGGLTSAMNSTATGSNGGSSSSIAMEGRELSGGVVEIYGGIVDAYRKIYQREGFRGFTKGLLPRLVYIMPASALTFTFFEFFKTHMQLT